jgi:hypothetical protein
MRGVAGPVGLCEQCRHVRVLKNDRGSIFIQCLLGLSDPTYPKYPRLPMVSCQGFEPCLSELSTPPTAPSSPTAPP